TAARLLGVAMTEVNGADLTAALTGGAPPTRDLYAESFAPLVEFGWAPLRSVRSSPWKFIGGPKPELFDLAHDSAEDSNLAPARATLVHALGQRADQIGGPDTNGSVPMDPKAIARLRALGYVGASRAATPADRPDPKDRRDLIARLAQVTAGELEGPAL